MMERSVGSAHIRTKATGKGTRRYVVRYRLGGRAFQVVHGGSFKTLREARARRDFILGELAACRDPAVSLRALQETPTRRTVGQWARAWLDSRVDLDTATHRTYESHLRAIAVDPL